MKQLMMAVLAGLVSVAFSSAYAGEADMKKDSAKASAKASAKGAEATTTMADDGKKKSRPAKAMKN